MADQKIELEIKLDDGSIKKAFATIKDEAQKVEKETTGLFDGLGAGAGLVVINQGIELFNKMSSAIKSVANEMINLSLEAEKVRVVQQQFADFTKAAGIATESFNEAIQASVAGLIDDEEALQIANQAIIRIGTSAQKLPEIFELSRKAAAAGFGDMASNAEAFTQAIQTGQTRQLRGLGILADVTKAQEEFARSIGLTASQLTEEQKAFVNSNTILEAAGKKFKDVDENVAGLSLSLQRLKVAVSESYERMAKDFDSVFGPAIKGFIDGLTDAINGNANAAKANAVDVKNLSNEIETLNQKLLIAQQRLSVSVTETQFNVYSRQVQNLNEQLAVLEKRQEKQKLLENDLLAARINGYQKWKEADDAKKLTEQQEEQRLQNKLANEQKFQQQILQFQQQELAARAQKAQFIQDEDLRREELESIHQANLTMIAEQGETARDQIRIQFSDKKGFDEMEREMLITEQQNAELASRQAAEEAYRQNSMDGFQKWAQANAASIQKVADMARINLVTGLSGAFQSLGKALAEGQNALDAFGKAFLGILGDIAIKTGEMFIALALANSFIPVFGLSGFGAFAAGAALIVLGGVLKSFAGSSSSTTQSNAGGNGGYGDGGYGAGGNGFNAAEVVPEQRNQPNTVVNFNVQGSIMDSEDTQNRIVELLNSAIDTKGSVIRGL